MSLPLIMCSRLGATARGATATTGHMEDRVHWTNQNPMQRTPFSSELLRSCWQCHDPYYDSTLLPANVIWDEKVRSVYLTIKKIKLNIMVAVNEAILRIGERTHVARNISKREMMETRHFRRAIRDEKSWPETLGGSRPRTSVHHIRCWFLKQKPGWGWKAWKDPVSRRGWIGLLLFVPSY